VEKFALADLVEIQFYRKIVTPAASIRISIPEASPLSKEYVELKIRGEGGRWHSVEIPASDFHLFFRKIFPELARRGAPHR